MSVLRISLRLLVLGAWLAAASRPSMSGLAQTSSEAPSFVPIYEAGHGEIEEDFCIGEEESDDYLLADPILDVDTRGNIYVLDKKVEQIMKFNTEGTFLFSFSRRGEGPGDMGAGSALQLVVTRKGTVVMADPWLDRLTEFSGDGRYLQTAKLDRGFLAVVERMAAGPKGKVILEVQTPLMEDWTQYDDTLLLYDAHLGYAETLDSLRVQDMTVEQSFLMELPYANELVWDVTPSGGLVMAHTNEYTIRILSPDLEPGGGIERDVEPLPVTAEDKRRYVEDASAEIDRELRRRVDLGDRKSLIAGLRVDHEGNILVCLFDETDSETHYDVYDPSGRFLASATLPPLDRLDVIRGGCVYFVKRFEDAPLPPQVCRGRLVAAPAP
jgi:hypothetical protein